MDSPVRVTPEARQYGFDQLCRRAGLKKQDGQRWRTEIVQDGTMRLRHAAGKGSVVFRRACEEISSRCVVRKTALRARYAGNQLPQAGSVDDLIVPFCMRASKSGQALFVETSPGEFHCTEDLPASTVLVLSRYEELETTDVDEYGRFRAASSAAAHDDYLARPIVDEWGVALEQVLAAIDPAFSADRKLRVKISHDVDLIGIPFGLREPAVQLIARRDVRAALWDVLSGFTNVVPGSLRHVITVCEQGIARGLRPALYWKASGRTKYDSGYDIADPRIARVIHWAQERGVEMGIHPGFETLSAPEKLAREVERWRGTLGTQETGGRQHYLRWRPESWLDWEHCGLAYDSSVGYADCAGFRAGTCWPYVPWLWAENRRAKLLEIPLIAMDRTLVSPRYMGLSEEASVELVKDLIRKCADVGGVFTLLWHNNCLGRPFSMHYPLILDALSGIENYEWRRDTRDFVTNAHGMQTIRS